MSRFTFNPPEEELISYYLNNKITNKYDLEEKQIREVNICHHEPADLPGLAKIESSHTWYFISPVEKFGKLNRTKRASKTGHWKITGNSCMIKDVDGNPIGLKKFLVFQENKRSSSSSSSSTSPHLNKTTWIIHELHSFLHHPNKDAFVLCKLMKKRARRSGGAADTPPAVTEPSLILTSNPILNQSENKNIIEDSGEDYYNDLEDLLPEFHTTNWLHHSHQVECTTQSWEQGESSCLKLGENRHVYGQNTMQNSNDVEFEEYYWNSKVEVGQIMFPNAVKKDQI